MANPELDNYVNIPLTTQQIEFLSKKLKDKYNPDHLLSISELIEFIKNIYP